MNRAEKMFSVLRDGRPHSRQDIFTRVGYMLTNNAAAELRTQGYDVRQERDGDLYLYQLVSLPQPSQSVPVPSGGNPADADGRDGSENESGQLRLVAA